MFRAFFLSLVEFVSKKFGQEWGGFGLEGFGERGKVLS